MMLHDGEFIGEFGKSPKFAIYMFLFLGFIAFVMIGVGGGALLIAGILVILIVMLIAESLRYRVYLYQHALVCRGLFRTIKIRLDDKTRYFYRSVSESVNGLPVGTYLYIKIENGRNSVQLSPRLNGIEELREHFLYAEATDVLPAARATYATGRTVDFSLIQIKGGKIIGKKSALTVADVSRMFLDGGVLAIWGKSNIKPVFKLELTKLANTLTLLTLLEDVTN